QAGPGALAEAEARDDPAARVQGGAGGVQALTRDRRLARAYRFTATYFVSRYSSIPSRPPSRPKPDCFTPPKGAAGFDTIPWLSPTIPVSRPSHTRNARSKSLVYT